MRVRGNVLVSVMMVMVIGVIVAVMALSLIITNTQTTNDILQAERVRAAAESGVENGILQTLRNPAGYSGETLIVDDIPVEIVATPGETITLTVTAEEGDQRHRYQVTLERINGILTVTSWKEVFE